MTSVTIVNRCSNNYYIFKQKKKHKYTKIILRYKYFFYSLYINNLLLKGIFLILPLLIIIITNDIDITQWSRR